ncbi:piggyBac transposable element-derived protein 3 isoform X9 [Bactrocera dorsalis]|uniref:PiggyBac transposable element-derived protein 3 isoform X9 n=1 Tax=Bactrocera dorsalis TaxID=27457 RepID=A0ABM3K4U8_BACDO|nr:piggyBac transposable element-derived protein 3 isoform X9 [Bactrocera dorsalis]
MIKFAGVHLMMGNLKYPQGKLYWNRELCVSIIADTMNRDRFFELRNYLHFVDINKPNADDKLWKIRPLIDPILKRCHKLSRSKHMSIDEQIISFSGRCEFRQYVPSKPNSLGLKNFILAARDGLVLDFEIYVGKNTLPQEVVKSLGLGAGMVEKLCRTIVNSCVLYTDRFFTSLKLAELLLQKNNGIFLSGTVMINRIGPVTKKLKADKVRQKGHWDEKVRSDERVCVVKWMDTKPVTMLSTCTGGTPADTCKRWCKKQKRKIDVDRPAAIRNYNTCMGGIDLCDRLIAYYRCSMRTNKWTVRTFCHFLDLIAVNCWIMYRRCCAEEDIQRKDKLELLPYGLNLAKEMMNYAGGRVELPRTTSRSSTSASKRSRLNVTDDELDYVDEPPAKKRRQIIPQPPTETRLDNVGHQPRFVDNNFASKCRHPKCFSRCRTICVK